jgi:hypothetical protein
MSATTAIAIAGPLLGLAGLALAAWSLHVEGKRQRELASDARRYEARATVYVDALTHLHGVVSDMQIASPLADVYGDEVQRQRRLQDSFSDEQRTERWRVQMEEGTRLKARLAAFGSHAVRAAFAAVLDAEQHFADAYPHDVDGLDVAVGKAELALQAFESAIRDELAPLL